MRRSKVKISLTVTSSLLDEVDRGVRQRRYPSRSSAVDAALADWARAQRSAAIDAYYDGLSEDEKRESLKWAEAGYEAVARSAVHDGRGAEGAKRRTTGEAKRVRSRGAHRR